jgi:phosphohistidine phosphatase
MKHTRVLLLVRHAKSSWDNVGIADIDRTLKARGINNAYEVSRKLKLNDRMPDRIISSPAIRALHTAVIFARVFEFPLKNLQINNILYESSEEKMIEFIKKMPDESQSVMLFGHNPDVTYMVNYFGKKTVDDIPTSGVVILTFKCQNWKQISRDNLDSELYFYPSKEE